jgi:hypothetical protein
MPVLEAVAAPRAATASLRPAVAAALRVVDAELFAPSAVETGLVVEAAARILAGGVGPDVRDALVHLGWRLGRHRTPLPTVRATLDAVAEALDGPGAACGDLLRRHTATVVRSYRDGLEHPADPAERRAARCRALLDGQPDPDGGAPGRQWQVAVVQLPVPRVRLRELAVRVAAAVPALLVTDGPGHLAALGAGEGAQDLLATGLRERTGPLPQPPRVAVVAAGADAAVPAAYDRCLRLHHLAAAVGDPRPLVTEADLALETVLDGEGGEPVARILDRLPDTLLHTLRTLYRHDLDRRATSRALHVHRNTLDYRLGRITALAGVSPTSVRGIQLLVPALTARRLRDDNVAGTGGAGNVVSLPRAARSAPGTPAPS